MEFSSSLTLFSSDIPFLLEKRIKLLSAIEEEGSISKAAKKVPISYKAAWDAIDSINNLCPTPVVTKETGGKGGGGAKLTKYGKNLIKTYTLLQAEHEKFLSALTQMTDFNSGTLRTIQRVAMQISARNQLRGVVDKIVKGEVNTNLVIVPKSGHELFANISTGSVNSLDIKPNNEVIAIFKSSSVLLAKSDDIALSARNKIKGKVQRITKNNTNSEVVLDIGDGETIASVITTGAVKKLDIKEGDQVVAFIKSSDIMIGK